MSPRSSLRVDRRRRVLAEETRRDEQLVGKPRIFRGDSDAPPCRYGNQALRSLGTPVARFLPQRPHSLLVFFLVGLTGMVALLAANEWQSVWSDHLPPVARRPFALGAPGSLATWLASTQFGFALVVMLGIFSVRRHRRDDHRGRFMVWRVGMGLVLLASLDAHAQLRSSAVSVARALAPDSWWTSATPLGAVSVLLGAVVLTRFAIEMKSSRIALVWLAATGVSYALAGVVRLAAPHAPLATATETVLALLGHQCLLMSLLGYARDIVREALGETSESATPANPPAKGQQPSSKEAANGPPLKPLLKTVQAEATDEQPQGATADEPATLTMHTPDNQGEAKLSKAERRRLRKEKRRKAA